MLGSVCYVGEGVLETGKGDGKGGEKRELCWEACVMLERVCWKRLRVMEKVVKSVSYVGKCELCWKV
jgi:hypothetical protein